MIGSDSNGAIVQRSWRFAPHSGNSVKAMGVSAAQPETLFCRVQ